MAVTAASPSMSRWTAEFIDAELEREFRRRGAGDAARLGVTAVLVGVAFVLAFGYTDYLDLRGGPLLALLWSARGLTGALGLAVAWLLLRRPGRVTDGLLISGFELTLLGCFILVVLVRPSGLQWHVMLLIVITLSIYLFAPNRFIHALGIGLVGMAAFLAGKIIVTEPRYLDIARMALLLALTNTAGAITAYSVSRLRRREFALLVASERTNAELRREINARRRLEAELQRVASIDELTGLLNRRVFLALSTTELERARRLGEPLAVCLLDVDHFKRINDAHGHAVGDSALRAVAEACRGALREVDIIGRFGGEEFTVTLPGTSPAAASQVAERLRRRIGELVIDTPDGPVRLTATIGAAECRPQDAGIEEALARADRALYEGKRSGRDRVVVDVPDGRRA